MAANYLHGAETVEVQKGARQIRTIKSAVIGLVGTAPIHLLKEENRFVNKNVLLLSDKDAGLYGGVKTTGFTIPAALDAIYDHGAGTVVMVNVFDPSVHFTSVTDEAKTFAGGIIALANEGILSLTLKSSDGATTYVKGTDYTYDIATGVVTRISTGSIGVAAAVKATYTYADPTKVTAADLIGEIDAGGNRTGMQAWKNSFSEFGFDPKILIAPVYSTQNSIASELSVLADALRAFAYIDAPIGTTFQQAITGRGAGGSINFNTSSKRVRLCYPHLKVYDSASDSEVLEPMSQRLAGLRASIDLEFGYHYSSSNHLFKGVTGVETTLTARINDPACEVNMLNEVGITTYFNSFGTGILSWGNDSAASPTYTAIDKFECVRRTADIIEESIEYFTLQFMDRPIDAALLDSIVESVNSFLRTLKGRGVIIDGKCYYDPSRNPATELAAGHVTFSYEFLPPAPFERATFESFINIDLYNTLGA
ncbi:MAG: phage tail sheath subtilisin-like domain-containing protein [Campylobacterales bacterium]|nr:phage tail sheath subtilisin-like domain-containing protein [Campylobacterales bacterium]